MAWCRQATSHYLSQWWLSSVSPYDVARPQWFNSKWYFVIIIQCLMTYLIDASSTIDNRITQMSHHEKRTQTFLICLVPKSPTVCRCFDESWNDFLFRLCQDFDSSKIRWYNRGFPYSLRRPWCCKDDHQTLKRKLRHFYESFLTNCTGSCHFWFHGIYGIYMAYMRLWNGSSLFQTMIWCLSGNKTLPMIKANVFRHNKDPRIDVD